MFNDFRIILPENLSLSQDQILTLHRKKKINCIPSASINNLLQKTRIVTVQKYD